MCDWPEQRDSGWRVTVRLADARGAKAACYLSDEAAALLEPGQTLLGSAYWQDASVIKGTELSTFTSRGIFVLLYCEEMPTVAQGQAGSLRYLPQRMENAFRDKIARIWERDGTVAGLLQAELLGERSGISEELSVRFFRGGCEPSVCRFRAALRLFADAAESACRHRRRLWRQWARQC